MDDLPTPDELGEKLKAGEITREEAIEVMSERARREALAGLYGPQTGAPAGQTESDPQGTRRVSIVVCSLILLGLVLLYFLLQMLG